MGVFTPIQARNKVRDLIFDLPGIRAIGIGGTETEPCIVVFVLPSVDIPALARVVDALPFPVRFEVTSGGSPL